MVVLVYPAMDLPDSLLLAGEQVEHQDSDNFTVS